MKQLHLLFVITIAFFMAGCSTPMLEPLKVEATDQHIDYLVDVKPILDKHCVSCHSCYTSPYQAKFSSF